MTVSIPRLFERVSRKVTARMLEPFGGRPDGMASPEEVQRLLALRYAELARTADPARPPRLAEVGFRRYSQFEEDGILLWLFTLVGSPNRSVVELCCGPGAECMAANLCVTHGWQGYLFDGRARNIARARRFFARHSYTQVVPPVLTNAWITAENVNDLIRSAGAEGEVDLLSLDLDGVDYWLWRAIDVIRPRVVVCETHDLVPTDRALTVPYRPDFAAMDQPSPRNWFRSASLLAMIRLGRAKGYRFVGTHQFGFNAFFVREDLAGPLLPEADPATCHANPWTRRAQRELWPLVAGMEWVEVGADGEPA